MLIHVLLWKEVIYSMFDMKKKIIYHVGDISHPGGMERMVVLKANWLAEHGYDVTLLSTSSSNKSYFEVSPKLRCDFLSCSIPPLYSVRKNTWGAIKSVWWSIKSRREHKKKLRKYLASHSCDFFITLINRSFIPKMKDGSKKYFEIHFSSEIKRNFIRNSHGIYRFLYKLGMWYQEHIYREYDKFFVLTEKDWQLRGGGDNMVVMPNFITIEQPQKMPDYTSKNIISVGRLAPQKGYEYLFQAMSRVVCMHPDWHLHIYGFSYGREKYYRQLIEEAGVDQNVFIHNPVHDIVDKYLESSFYVMSSIYEGFPLCLGEAMACGLPCVSYDCNCGPSEIIKDGEDGIIVKEVRSVEKLADAINYMIEHPKLRKKMGVQAKKNIQRFSMDNIMQKWENYLQ